MTRNIRSEPFNLTKTKLSMSILEIFTKKMTM